MFGISDLSWGKKTKVEIIHFMVTILTLVLSANALVSCCEPPPNLGAKIPGNHWWRPARLTESKDHSSGRGGCFSLNGMVVFFLFFIFYFEPTELFFQMINL